MSIDISKQGYNCVLELPRSDTTLGTHTAEKLCEGTWKSPEEVESETMVRFADTK